MPLLVMLKQFLVISKVFLAIFKLSLAFVLQYLLAFDTIILYY